MRAVLHMAAEGISQILSLELCAEGCRASKCFLPGQAPGQLQGRASMCFLSLGSGAETAAAALKAAAWGRCLVGAGGSRSSSGEDSHPQDWDTSMKRIPAAGNEAPSASAQLPAREDSEHGSLFSLARGPR